jgi:hypothetical protein
LFCGFQLPHAGTYHCGVINDAQYEADLPNRCCCNPIALQVTALASSSRKKLSSLSDAQLQQQQTFISPCSLIALFLPATVACCS